MSLSVTSDLFLVSVVVLLLVMVVLLVLCWTLGRSRSRNLTELKVSAGEPSRILTIRTEPDHATQLLDHLLARVLNQEFAPESRDHYRKEPREEPQEELEGESGSSEADPQDYTAACLLNRAINTFPAKLRKWMTTARPPADTPDSSSSPPPPPDPTSQDQTDDPSPHPTSPSSQGSSSSQVDLRNEESCV